jgi:hypothetical protein
VGRPPPPGLQGRQGPSRRAPHHCRRSVGFGRTKDQPGHQVALGPAILGLLLPAGASGGPGGQHERHRLRPALRRTEFVPGRLGGAACGAAVRLCHRAAKRPGGAAAGRRRFARAAAKAAAGRRGRPGRRRRGRRCRGGWGLHPGDARGAEDRLGWRRPSRHPPARQAGDGRGRPCRRRGRGGRGHVGRPPPPGLQGRQGPSRRAPHHCRRSVGFGRTKDQPGPPLPAQRRLRPDERSAWPWPAWRCWRRPGF